MNSPKEGDPSVLLSVSDLMLVVKEKFVCQLQGCRKLGTAQAAVKMLPGLQSHGGSVRGHPGTNLTLGAVVRIQFLMDTRLEDTPGLCHIASPLWQIQYGSWLLSDENCQRIRERGMGFFA